MNTLNHTDRSAVNCIFNIDHDFGVMGYYNNTLRPIPWRLKTSISSGEGRNVARSNNALAYTACIELLPLGEFRKDGDFFESDLYRESTPKISINSAFSYNHKAIRILGQRGQFMPQSQDTYLFFVDMIAKYNGWAWATEFAARKADQQQIFSENDKNLYVYTGWGINSQLSYVYPSRFELAARYTYVEPGNTIKWFENRQEIYTLGASRYFPNHQNKIQLNLTYNTNPGINYAMGGLRNWNFMFQIETRK